MSPLLSLTWEAKGFLVRKNQNYKLKVLLRQLHYAYVHTYERRLLVKPTKQYELFSHQADMGVKGLGQTAKEAFEQAGLALTCVTTDLKLVKPNQSITIECQAPNLEILFYDWIAALIYEGSSRDMLFCRFDITQFDNQYLAAVVSGENVDVKKHQPSVEVKSPTLTCLEVKQLKGRKWVAQCVVDV